MENSFHSFGNLPFNFIDKEVLATCLSKVESVSDQISTNFLFQRENSKLKSIITIKESTEIKVLSEPPEPFIFGQRSSNKLKELQSANLTVGTNTSIDQSKVNLPTKVNQSASFSKSETSLCEVSLYHWYLQVQDTHMKLFGYLPSMKCPNKPTKKLYDAGFILSRKAKDLIRTKNGIFKLIDNIDLKKSNFSCDVAKYFEDGFPVKWKCFLKDMIYENESSCGLSGSLFMKTLNEKYLRNESNSSDKENLSQRKGKENLVPVKTSKQPQRQHKKPELGKSGKLDKQSATSNNIKESKTSKSPKHQEPQEKPNKFEKLDKSKQAKTKMQDLKYANKSVTRKQENANLLNKGSDSGKGRKKKKDLKLNKNKGININCRKSPRLIKKNELPEIKTDGNLPIRKGNNVDHFISKSNKSIDYSSDEDPEVEDIVNNCMNSVSKKVPQMLGHATPTTSALFCLNNEVTTCSSSGKNGFGPCEEKAKADRNVAKRMAKSSSENKPEHYEKVNAPVIKRKADAQIAKLMSDFKKKNPKSSSVVDKLFEYNIKRAGSDEDTCLSDFSDEV